MLRLNACDEHHAQGLSVGWPSIMALARNEGSGAKCIAKHVLAFS